MHQGAGAYWRLHPVGISGDGIIGDPRACHFAPATLTCPAGRDGENGVAPDGVVATEWDGARVVRTRPLCAYPRVARYRGTGDPADAANWEPAAPSRPQADRVDWLWAPTR
jgi:hypothetical protein